jgi:hypothetical protein
VIRDVTELREQGQVCRRVADLEVDLDTWRAGMRHAARREGMRIRTVVVEPAPTDGTEDVIDDQGDGLPPDQPDAAGPGPLVYAVRTDLPPDLAKMAATMNQLATDRLGPTIEAALRPPAPVTSLADERARRTGHPCSDPHPDRG